MSDTVVKDRAFDIEALAKNSWRSRISQFKREIRAFNGRPPELSSIGPRRRFSQKRHISKASAQTL